MQDLVQMMTQTLRMDGKDAVCEPDSVRSGSTLLAEFKLNRKYRDTLVLHGKVREEQEEFHFSELPTGQSHTMCSFGIISPHLSNAIELTKRVHTVW